MKKTDTAKKQPIICICNGGEIRNQFHTKKLAIHLPIMAKPALNMIDADSAAELPKFRDLTNGVE